jgi:CheY-like chemotaxis protein
MNNPVVLVVEDNPTFKIYIGDSLIHIFGKSTQIHIGATVEEARRLFAEHGETLSFILMDTNLVKGEETFELTREIRSKFSGPIIATSVSQENAEPMMECGCSHFCRKDGLLDFLPTLQF